MVLAFEKYEAIEKETDLQTQQKLWLEDYSNLRYSKARNKKHFMKWKENPQFYNPNEFTQEINMIGRKKDRLVIEFDEVEGEPNNPKEAFEIVKAQLIEKEIGFIHSTHGSQNSDYLWIEFTRNLTENEAQRFLYWIQPEGSNIDINFTYDKKVFPVLFAPHWKYSQAYELPVEFFKGNKVDFDKIKDIPKTLPKTTTKTSSDGFEYQTLDKEIRQTEEIELLTYKDFRKLKKDKNFIVEDFIYPSSVTMVYSPPAQFKSILALTLGMAISNGKKWLDLKTKKQPVLYLDGENSNLILKERLQQIYKGNSLKRNNFPFYVIKNGVFMDSKKRIYFPFLEELERIIREKEIKVLVVDTLHRFAFYDENSANDINLLYTQVFRPLIEDFGLSIVFLHHSTKGGNYRGSGDFLGMVDVSYQVRREGKTDKFNIVNEKCRSGEIGDIRGEIDFQEEYLRVHRLSEKKETEKAIKKIKEVTNKVQGIFKIGQEYQRKDIISFLEIEGYDFGSVKTLDRALKFLFEKGILDKTKGGRYRLL